MPRFQKQIGIKTLFWLTFWIMFGLSVVMFWQHFINSSTYNPPTYFLSLKGTFNSDYFSSYYAQIIFLCLVFALMYKFLNNDSSKHWMFGIYTLFVCFQFYRIYDFKQFIAKTMIENREPPNPISEIAYLEYALITAFLIMIVLYLYSIFTKNKSLELNSN
jgi:hypothetical protein